jgi:hypothetical protein
MPTILLILIILMLTYPGTYTQTLNLPKADVVHTASGLIMHYLTDYTPSNNILTFTVSIPMVADMCYLIPIQSMRKIPQCDPKFLANLNSQISTEEQMYRTLFKSSRLSRKKRFLTDIISIGIGSAALSLSTVNTIQIANLRAEISHVTTALNNFDENNNVQTAQILHLTTGQEKLAQALNHTQVAINRTVALVNEHVDILKAHDSAIRTLSGYTLYMSNRLSSIMHSVETHFIHTSIDDIVSNKLNLQFIHHRDLPTVLSMIMNTTNIEFNEAASTLSPMELVTSLLVQQRINFRPTNLSQNRDSGNVIGYLLFTSFFSVPGKVDAPFSLYELTPVPFNHEGKRVRLAKMPFIIGIKPGTLQFIRWSKSEAQSCHFGAMSSCRETPAIRSDLADECIHQILTDRPLGSCRIEPNAEQVFVQRIGQHWIVSTNSSTKCHRVEKVEEDKHDVKLNDAILLPPVAIITTIDTKSMACDHFFLPGLPIQNRPPMSIIENQTLDFPRNNILDLHNKLANSSHWSKLPYIPPDIQAIFDFVAATPKPHHNTSSWHAQSHTIPLWIIIGTAIIVIVFLTRHLLSKRRMAAHNLMVTLPPLRSL